MSDNLHRKGVDAGPRGHVERFHILAAEFAVRWSLGHLDRAQQFALRVEDLNAGGRGDVEIPSAVDGATIAADSLFAGRLFERAEDAPVPSLPGPRTG